MARWRRLRGWWIALPLVVGVAVLAVGLHHPGGPLHGSVATGPSNPTPPEPLALRRVFHVEWGVADRHLVLVVRGHQDCRRPEPRVTSTAPARLEVTVTRPAADCLGRAVRWRYPLPRPLVSERGQVVTVLIDGQRYRAPDDPDASF